MNKFLVTEDNAGGLQLYVFDGGACVYAGYGFEQDGRLGELAGCLEALAEGDDPTRWDGGADNPRAAWNQVQRLLGEVDQPQVVVDHAAIYTERMGAAGQREFAGQIAAAESTVEIADALRDIEAWDGASGIDLLNLVETYRGLCISAGEDEGKIDGGLGAVFSGFKTRRGLQNGIRLWRVAWTAAF